MIVHFKRDEVERLAKHSVEASRHKALYEQEETAKPGLWLVGDEGVYLMSNAYEALKKDPDDPDSPNVVAYAIEICPVDDNGKKKPDIDDWWGAKQASFGGDDGADFIPYESADGPSIKGWLESNECEPRLAMDLSPGSGDKPGSFSLISLGLGPILAGAVKKAAGKSFDRFYCEGLKWSAWGIPVGEMDRVGMVAYIGSLKLVNRSLQAKLDAAMKAGAAAMEPKTKVKLKIPTKQKK